MKYAVWYAIKPSFDGTAVTAKTLTDTHRKVREIDAKDREEAFMMMQAENWSPNGEARGLIEELELKHTSMSVGDVLLDEDGRIWVCGMRGWETVMLGGLVR